MKQLLMVLLLGVALLSVACSGSDEEASQPQEVQITARDIAYEETLVEVVVGEPVALTLRNEGALEHDFSIMHIPAEVTESHSEEEEGHDMGHMDEMPELHVAAMPGESSTLTFNPSEPGEYTYFCTVEGHQEAGMEGTLVVTEG